MRRPHFYCSIVSSVFLPLNGFWNIYAEWFTLFLITSHRICSLSVILYKRGGIRKPHIFLYKDQGF